LADLGVDAVHRSVSGRRPEGSIAGMSRDEIPPGKHVEDKIGPSDAAGRPQPDAPEVESARLLANDARDALRVRGLEDEEIRRLADEYVALDLGEDTDAFILWAVEHRRDKT
jgi:hypothetical protein